MKIKPKTNIMKKLIAIIALVALPITGQSQTKETRNVGNFTELSAKGSFDYVLIKGAKPSVTLYGPADVLPLINTEVSGNKLDIGTKSGSRIKLSRGQRLVVTVYYTNINEISFQGSGNLKGENTIESDKLSIAMQGSGSISLDINAKQSNIETSGSGSATVSGKADTVNYELTGSGSISAGRLQGNTVNASLSGSGNMKIVANKALQAKLTGSGSIAYGGNPEKKNVSKTGSGSVSSF